MGCSEPQELFLLEFLIDRVNVPSVQAMQDDCLHVKTCIEFKILNLPPIFICQDASSDQCNCLGDDAQVFRRGKSCLFALPSKLLKPPVCSFPISMSVYKKLPPSVLPDVMTIGSNRIECRDMLNALLEDCSPNPCATLKNNFRITTATGQCCGEVTVFIRLSKLGRKVVTQFQNPNNKKPYLFKGIAESPVFQCKRVSSTCDESFATCSCEKPSTEREPEDKSKSCCGLEGKPRSRGSGQEEPRARKKSRRPCCRALKSAANSCSTKARGAKACPSKHEVRPEVTVTRQCGCEVKDDAPHSCGK
ncbi:uncharacterized protein LOC131669689 [Phymastichus coffea]|uniref:uncharacterized protein LOC131669689 n=1 Tax=Phymastichus coffea TaxID=108790 RepID=UPI00273A8F40|nr:uncharacterized protein LOC131669689 [Phymastichus coffea]